MLAQINGYQLDRTIFNGLLRSFLPYILKNQEWTFKMSLLSKVKRLTIIAQNKLIRQNQEIAKCPICEKFHFQGNLFILIIHMEVEHQINPLKRYYTNEEEEQFVPTNYFLTFDGLEIHFLKRNTFLHEQNRRDRSDKKSDKNSSLIPQSYLENSMIENQTQRYLSSSLKERNMALLQRIFSKIQKRLQTISTKRKYYHSYNVYRSTVTAESEEQNSEDEQQNLVEKQLERLRIHDFADVSDWDKIIFLEWNELVRKEKKQSKIIYENRQIMTMLEKFCVICRKKQIPKINFTMHLYTLWSCGKIKDFEIVQLCHRFGSCLIEQKTS